MEPGDIETHILILRKEMQWAKENTQSIRTDLQELQNSQNRLLDLFLDLYRDMGHLRGHMDERFSRIDAGLSDLETGSRDLCGTVHRETAGVHKEIAGLHGSLWTQTRWILAALLGAVAIVAVGLPAALQFARRWI